MTLAPLPSHLRDLLDQGGFEVSESPTELAISDRRSEAWWFVSIDEGTYRLVEVQRRERTCLFRTTDPQLLARAILFFLRPSPAGRSGLLLRLPREPHQEAAGFSVITLESDWETLEQGGHRLPFAMRASPPFSRVAGFSYLVDADLDDIIASYQSPTAEPLFRKFLWRIGSDSIEAGYVFNQ